MADIILNKPEAGTQAVFEGPGTAESTSTSLLIRQRWNVPAMTLFSVSTTAAPLSCVISIRPIPRIPCPTS